MITIVRLEGMLGLWLAPGLNLSCKSIVHAFVEGCTCMLFRQLLVASLEWFAPFLVTMLDVNQMDGSARLEGVSCLPLLFKCAMVLFYIIHNKQRACHAFRCLRPTASKIQTQEKK